MRTVSALRLLALIVWTMLLCLCAAPAEKPANNSSAAASPGGAGWFAFEPGEDAFAADSGIDLRELNEKFAGEHGRITAQAGQFIHSASGQPVRFWAVNGPPNNLRGEPLRRCARLPRARRDRCRVCRFSARRSRRRSESHRTPTRGSASAMWCPAQPQRRLAERAMIQGAGARSIR